MPSRVAAGGRIDSWKEIAAYLERDVSTVVRWEKERGLPVHRIPGGQRQAVFAFEEELDRWLTSSAGRSGSLQAESNGREPDRPAPDSFPPAVVDDAKPGELANAAARNDSPPRRRWLRASYWIAGLIAASIVLAVGRRYLNAGWLWNEPHIGGPSQLTANGLEKWGLVTAGETLYFGQEQDGWYALAAMPAAGGAIRVLWSPHANVLPLDVSSDGKKLLALTSIGVEGERKVWVVPLDGGEPRTLQGVLAHSAAWAPDGTGIAFAFGNKIYLTSEKDSPREAGSFAAIPRGLMWSQDSRHVRFILDDEARNSARQWGEIYGDGMKTSAVHPLVDLPDKFAESDWLPSHARNEVFLFGAFRSPAGTPIGLAQIRERWWGPSLFHIDWTGSVPQAIAGIASLERSSKLFVLGEPRDRTAFLRFDVRAQASRGILPGASGTFLDYSRDGRMVLYVADDHRIEISRADGSASRQVAAGSELIELPRWSPDGKRIAYMAESPGRPWRISVVDLATGVTREASEGSDNQGAPTWSPDGRFLAYGGVRCEESNSCAIHRIELATGKVITLPGSEGMFTARWSPDGRFIAALHMTRHQLMLFDVRAGEWRKLADGVDGSDMSWSGDSRYLYASVRGTGAGIDRIRIADGQRQKVVNLDSEDKADLSEVEDMQFSLAPDNAIILHRRIHSEEIYSYDLPPR